MATRRRAKTIALCASASFYAQLLTVASELEGRGYKVIIPIAARHMENRGDFQVEHYKTWFKNPKDFKKKSALILKHFHEIQKSDAIMVLNYKKNGVSGYIGGNVLMEMAIAFFLKKPIHVLNDVLKTSNLYEEIMAMNPAFLKGELDNLRNK